MDQVREKRIRSSHMLAFFIIQFVFNMAASFVHPVTPTIIQNLHLSNYMFGLAFASMSFMQFVFSPFWGQIINYIGSRRAMLISGIGYAVGQIFFGLAHTELQFVLARMLAGGFCGGAFVGYLNYVVNCSSDEKRGRNLAINATIQTVASAFGYFVGGMIGELNVYYSVWLQVIVLAVTSVMMYFVCTDDANRSLKDVKAGALVKECNPLSAIMQSRRFMTKMMAVLFIYFGLSNLGFVAFDQCFNYYLRDQFGFSSGYNGTIKAVLGLISLLANGTVCMWILKQKNVSAYMVGIMAICSISMIGVIVLDSIVPFVLVNVFFFACYYISLPLSQNMVAELGKGPDSNLVMGSFNAIKSFGSIFGALFSGFIYEMDPKLPFIFGFIAFAVATVFTEVYRRMENGKN